MREKLTKGVKVNMINNVVVRMEKSGNRYNAYDSDGNKYTSEIGTSTRKGAYEKGMALERRTGKGGRTYWWKVPMEVFETTTMDLTSNMSSVEIPTDFDGRVIKGSPRRMEYLNDSFRRWTKISSVG